ncbi:hypothetical protein LINPERPRIM_LOCUS20433 [Linum perenne]
MWCSHPSYTSIVQNTWSASVYGSPLIRICKKLQLLKGELKNLNRREYSDISKRVLEAERAMSHAQMNALHNPTSSAFEDSDSATTIWTNLCSAEESFYRQKARVHWITEGDKNTGYFHKSMKARHARNLISVTKKNDGSLCTSVDQIASEAIDFYQRLLGTEDPEAPGQTVDYFQDLFPQRVFSADSQMLIEPVSAKEIQTALFSLGADKSPSHDGFTVHFY